MSNFAFLPSDFRVVAESAMRAEGHIMGDPRAACFHARFALEAAVHWLYRHERALRMPYDQSLGALLHDNAFQNLLPEAVFQKARVIQKVGNQAVHNAKPIPQYIAMQTVRELHHVCYWLTRTYSPATSIVGVEWNDAQVPQPIRATDAVPRAKLEELEKQLADQNAAQLKQQQERDALDAELQALRDQLAEARAAAEAKPDPHDYSEAETRKYLIDVDLNRAGWPLDQKRDIEYEVTGMPNNQGVGYVDYVLWGDDGKPLGLVEAKKSTADPQVGQQQAKLYADCLEQMHGQRPIIFYTNGYETWIWDDKAYPPRRVSGYYKKDELQRIILRRGQRSALNATKVNEKIAGRYYQKRAIGSIFNQFTQSRRKALLVMATGTGKTRTAIALVDVLQRAGWIKRALFLADRVSLVNQAIGAFKTHLPESSPVNLVTEKDKEGRVYASTYPTMMGMIDETKGKEARFGPGYFDLIVIDEAHRSVYQKYGGIFRYFDSLLVGLTATPREQVDRNTYELFDLEPGVPTDAYELETAVRDGFLVPPKVEIVDMQFPREGIKYDDLSEEEKERWEGIDWGDEVDERGMPKQVNSGAINSWLFNEDTVDKVLRHLMQNGHHVEAGDRLAKSIIFARNHKHAQFIEERFNFHYPQYHGHFARVIDNYATYAQSLIDDFSVSQKEPHIAISVDMLDTGIDVPEVANLVFFKPVYSKIKFWQMIGRGTRLCPELFGPEEDKTDFRVFDFCFNFDFFKEHPDGIEASGGAPLGTQLFRKRVELLAGLQTSPETEPSGGLSEALTALLFGEVASMNRRNFFVRERLSAVERYQKRSVWDRLGIEDQECLKSEIAGLPSELPQDDIESRMFDLTMLKMQLAHMSGEQSAYEGLRKRVIEIASLLEEKDSIPAIQEQLQYLKAIQDTAFWEDIGLLELEKIRQRLRGLMPFLDKRNRKIVYTDFQDEITGVREAEGSYLPKMTGAQYQKKVEDYLRNHLDHLVIKRLRSNQPLTEVDLQGLEQALVEIGEDEGSVLLQSLLIRSEAPSLAYFVRKIVGMDRAAVQEAFAQFISDRSLGSQQMRFIEMVIEQLVSNGVVEPKALYEAPYSSLHAGGPEELFSGHENVIDGVFGVLQEIRAKVA